MGPLDKDVVRPDALTATSDGLALEIHQHWYRSLPLTSVGVLDVEIDGAPVKDATIEANGKTYRFEELAEQPDEWWFTTDAITVHIPRHGTKPGDRHQVKVDLGLLIPYLLIGPPD